MLPTPHPRALPPHRPHHGRRSRLQAPRGGRDRACMGCYPLLLHSHCPSKNSIVSACSSVTYRCYPPSSNTPYPSPIDHGTHAARPARHRLRSTAKPLGLDAAAGYHDTLSLVGKPRADLPSGERSKACWRVVQHRRYAPHGEHEQHLGAYRACEHHRAWSCPR